MGVCCGCAAPQEEPLENDAQHAAIARHAQPPLQDKDGENLTKTITITKEIEEKMRSLLGELGDYGGACYDCAYPSEEVAEYKRELYAEANELLKALNMEPIEVPDHYTEGYQQRLKEAEHPTVHTCMTEATAKWIGIASEFYKLDFTGSDNTEDQ